ncbi:hypothetical protein BFW01_g6467 [Lasiodiplodia theobromae]|uniref:Uncharacterized protein n=1 Tax=Lasiodiplodia theobromae TaxID=45133 RepID=A0A5N5D9Z4_9PEZI|nr:uncharacterized protein LTHEOB_11230 [Lasiodiplodia theobromae]KAB2574549.1 hypothetical protein DBV05_g6778 [Lasiodiplodia theobromae]KAF4537910.1 hypothetical protein LTHEOB_11230 [Lasiodiplodia theobromae]KAF9635572.1 hypothetical protein BFW01_g6467 [Lasiodiplodia theobromae]
MGFWKNPFLASSSQPQEDAAELTPSSSPLPTPSAVSATSPPIKTASAPPSVHENARLSTVFEVRVALAGTIALLSGLTLGMAHGSQSAALRYRAENAHRLPTDATGWYLYHKSKNYHAMLGGVREGLRMGVKLSIWVSGFFMCEEAIDRIRGLGDSRGDFGSTVVAGLGTAGAWSVWNRFPPITIARTAKMGLAVGLGYGLLQDAVSLLRGQRLGYIEYFRNIPTRVEDRRQRKIEQALARRGRDGETRQQT